MSSSQNFSSQGGATVESGNTVSRNSSSGHASGLTSTSAATNLSSSTSSLSSTLRSNASSKSSVTFSSPSAPSAATTSTVTHMKGVTSGAAAGIGIGCAIIGGLIALAFGFFFFRRRNASQSSRRSDGPRDSSPKHTSDKEVMVFGTAAAQRPTSSGDLDDILPQEADDSTIRQKASTLFDQVELYVENFYYNAKAPMTPTLEAELARFSSPHLSEPLVGLLRATSSPTILIKHCLANHIISLTSPTGAGTTRSLLPPGISEMMSAMNRGPARKPTPDTGFAFSRWRQLTAYLRPDLLSPRGSGATTTNPEQVGAVEEAASSFTRVFVPWARPEHTESERIGHLTHIVNSAISLAIWLFAQPASFRYDWKVPAADGKDRGGRKGGVSVVVVPGLVKVSDGRGQLLQSGQHGIVEPVVKRA